MKDWDQPSTFTPTPSDIQWTEALVSMIRDGGIWGWPENQAIYRIDKRESRFVLINSGPNFRNEGHERLRMVAAQMTPPWTVAEETP